MHFRVVVCREITPVAARLGSRLRARRWGSKRVAKNAQFVVVCLGSSLRGNDGVGDDDASRFTASRFPGQSCTCVGMTTESGAAAGRSIESLAAETGAILPIPDALTSQCLIFPDSSARRREPGQASASAISRQTTDDATHHHGDVFTCSQAEPIVGGAPRWGRGMRIRWPRRCHPLAYVVALVCLGSRLRGNDGVLVARHHGLAGSLSTNSALQATISVKRRALRPVGACALFALH